MNRHDFISQITPPDPQAISIHDYDHSISVIRKLEDKISEAFYPLRISHKLTLYPNCGFALAFQHNYSKIVFNIEDLSEKPILKYAIGFVVYDAIKMKQSDIRESILFQLNQKKLKRKTIDKLFGKYIMDEYDPF